MAPDLLSLPPFFSLSCHIFDAPVIGSWLVYNVDVFFLRVKLCLDFVLKIRFPKPQNIENNMIEHAAKKINECFLTTKSAFGKDLFGS